ncbi:MAG: AAA family ATPase [Alphaproteobacteria bacterium]|nr:AAA family ATPase [Alphaproteobacteria bacterium]
MPDIDSTYQFDHDTTMAILAGFAHNRRVMVQGYHGTGKSTHIEQVAARLNWPCVRINLDSHVSRVDLVGKDAIVLKEGKQITEWKEGLLPWSLQNPVALVFDEYDAGRLMLCSLSSACWNRKASLPCSTRTVLSALTRLSDYSPPPTRLASVIQQAFIMARTRSIRARWIAGILW